MQTTQMKSRPTDRPETVGPERLAIAPLVDVYENADEILLFADVPGATEDGVDIHLEKSELHLSAKRADAADVEYRRAFVLPAAVDPDRVAAELRDGVLSVHLPKRESAKPRTIAVRAG